MKNNKKILEGLLNDLFGASDSVDDDIDNLSETDSIDDLRIIELNDENGKKSRFEFLDLIKYGGEEYVVLLPAEDSEEAGEVVILRLEDSENDDEETYCSIEDDATLMAVFEIFKEKFKDEFDFVD